MSNLGGGGAVVGSPVFFAIALVVHYHKVLSIRWQCLDLTAIGRHRVSEDQTHSSLENSLLAGETTASLELLTSTVSS